MLEVCDGNGLLIEAQLRGLTFSNTAFAVATSEVQQARITHAHAASVKLQIWECDMHVEEMSLPGLFSSFHCYIVLQMVFHFIDAETAMCKKAEPLNQR